jgi:dimethylhistidine N-methyltransferase
LIIEAAPQHASKRLSIVSLSTPTRAHPENFAVAVRAGLRGRPRSLPWQFFYDELGSRLFDRICGLPEYYLTRTEDAILRDHAEAMVAGWSLVQPPCLLELGSGSAVKTQRLITAALKTYGTLHYVPIDVSATFLEESAQTLVARFPALNVTGYVADYQTALPVAAARIDGPKLVVFLGSSIGNYSPEQAIALLGQVARIMRPEDRLLLGTDLAKDRATLEAAYDDAQGVTAQFNGNLLRRINRELGADFDLDQFRHHAVYRPELGRVEMHLIARSDQVVLIPAADLTVRFEAGESIHTESSYKYTRDQLRHLADRSGLIEEAFWVDRDGRFRVQRWRLRDRSRAMPQGDRPKTPSRF